MRKEETGRGEVAAHLDDILAVVKDSVDVYALCDISVYPWLGRYPRPYDVWRKSWMHDPVKANTGRRGKTEWSGV
jgi:hypothetical protein